MYALSVRQPWAWGIIHGPKRIENRSRRTNHRGPLLIHASSSKMGHFIWPSQVALPRSFAFGALIGMVNVIGCVPVSQMSDDPFASGPWCWLLDDPQPLPEPIPWKGSVSLFQVPDEILE